MSSIIQVRDISKSYIITHEGRERYTALRDVMARRAKKLFSFPSWKPAVAITREEFWALKDIGFDIEQGDRVGIIGRNGAGKSTLLKVLSRITEPTTGSIKLKGRVASLLEVGTGFHPELTGRENIFLNGAILGMSRIEIRKHFDAIVDFAEVEKFLDTPVKRYSSGMYVRLAFAVAAHMEPEILIIDEVLAVGDAQFQKKCLGKMEDVSKNEGRTVLFVSHNTGVVSQLCNRAMWLNQGSVKDYRETDEVLREYIQYLGSKDNTSFSRENTDINKIASVSLYNEDIASTSFLFKDRIDISIRLNLDANIGNLSAGIAVLNSLKQKIFTTHYDFEFNGETGKSGTRVLNCSIPTETLVPGNYSLDVGLFRSGLTVYDYIKDVCSFEVVDSGSTMSGYSDYGFINVPCKWATVK